MIALRDVGKRFGALTVLDGFSLTLPDAGVTALMGPSGCGKTTLLRLIAGLERPDEGVLETGGRKVSMVFQEDRLIPSLTAKGNVMAVLGPGREAESRAEALLAACGLEDAMRKLPAELSGGMKRRVAVARAVAYGGGILLLDEPFQGLDAQTREAIAAFLREEVPPQSAVLLVTHDPEEAARYASRLLRLDGPPLTVRSVKDL